MGEGMDELRGGLKTSLNFHRPQGPMDSEQEYIEDSQSISLNKIMC